MAQMIWENKFTMGNAITIASMLGGMAIAWTTIVAQVNTHEQQLRALEQRIEQQRLDASKQLDAFTTERLFLREAVVDIKAEVRALRQEFAADRRRTFDAAPR